MDTKAKCILVMVALCILITPAFSQGGERDGRNGNPGSNMGPAQSNAILAGPNGAPFGQGSGIEQGQAPDVPRFNGCNTRLQKMLDKKKPIKPPSDEPNGLGNEFGLQGEPHDGEFFGFGGPNEHAWHRSIMGHDHPQVPPKKSMMEKKHLKMHKKLLKHKNFPEHQPMKSIMGHGR